MITITMVIVMTVHGQDFERHEYMPNIEQCWRTAAERVAKIPAGWDKLGISCVLSSGESA